MDVKHYFRAAEDVLRPEIDERGGGGHPDVPEQLRVPRLTPYLYVT